MTAYDATGTPVNLQLRWAKVDSAALGVPHTDTWNLFYQSNPNATGPQTAWINAGTNFVFGPNGSLVSPSGSTITLANVAVSNQSLGNLTVNFGSGGLTQYASVGGTTTINQIQQDGYAAGQLQSVAVNNSGLVVGTFSNGQNSIWRPSHCLTSTGPTLKPLDAAPMPRLITGVAIAGATGTIGGACRRFEHRHRRRIHQADRDPAGLLCKHQGDHDGTNHGSGSPERAAVIVQQDFNWLIRAVAMSLSSALAIAMAGLHTNQAALSIVSSNISNAQTPGYVARTLTQIEVAGSSADAGASVRTTGVNRQLDLYLQTQLRTETSAGAYADKMSNVLAQLQGVYGAPGGAGTLETSYNNFTSALQALSANSGAQSARSLALSTAQSLALQLNTATQGVQALRSNAEQDIAAAVVQANNAMTQIAKLNSQLQALPAGDNNAATLEDQRDTAIKDLAQLMDIRVVTDNANVATVYTTSGLQLVGVQASQLSFNSQGTLNASSLWNSNPALSTAGTLTLTFANGANVDLIATNWSGPSRRRPESARRVWCRHNEAISWRDPGVAVDRRHQVRR